MSRTYEKTHPWISFEFSMKHSDAFAWMNLGEVQSKCEHLAGVPLSPDVAEKFHQLYLAKGAMATTAIEGNTLSEEEVEQRINGKLNLPPTKEYLGLEVDNVVRVANGIVDKVLSNGNHNLTVEDIQSYNAQILEGLKTEDGVVAGRIREYSVTVGRYRGAPPEDCEYLLQRLCEWLSGPSFTIKPGYEVVAGVLKAIISHIYLAWIHPFGDGNGRTARMLEVRFLLESGAPAPAAHLLSNFYNQTRNKYYQKLDEISKNGGDIMPFLEYAIDGLCQELKEQIKSVRGYQFDVIWKNFVHEKFRDRKTVADHRRRDLVLALSEAKKAVSIAALRRVNPDIAAEYATKTMKALNRDINTLLEMGLIAKEGRTVYANFVAIEAFLPIRRTDHLPHGLGVA